MSRSGYSDDGETFSLWSGAVKRAIEGKRGQAFLRALIEALDAMPEKRLAAETFVDIEPDGGRCAMGAAALANGLSREQLATIDEYDRDAVGKVLNIAPALAAEIAYENDEGAGYIRWINGRPVSETPEQRWQRMRNWAVANLIESRPRERASCSWCCRSFTIRYGVVAWHRYNGARCPGAGAAAREPGDLAVTVPQEEARA